VSPTARLGSPATLDASALRGLCAAWEDLQRTRLSLTQRGLDDLAAKVKPIEDHVARQIGRDLRRHVVWPWLAQYPGLGGVHVARLIALIGDPWTFPGRRCTRGHYIAARAETLGEIDHGSGSGCPLSTLDGPCDGSLLPPRSGTGVRSLWHYCGLHVVDGRSPRKAKGQRADWSPVARTIVLMPGGIAEQIVRLRVPKYRDLYDAAKDRLTAQREIDVRRAIEQQLGPALTEGPESDAVSVSDCGRGLRPFQIDGIARKIAAKAFIGDLLVEWKRSTDGQPRFVSEAAA